MYPPTHSPLRECLAGLPAASPPEYLLLRGRRLCRRCTLARSIFQLLLIFAALLPTIVFIIQGLPQACRRFTLSDPELVYNEPVELSRGSRRVDLERIELSSPGCKPGALPLSYRPFKPLYSIRLAGCSLPRKPQRCGVPLNYRPFKPLYSTKLAGCSLPRKPQRCGVPLSYRPFKPLYSIRLAGCSLPRKPQRCVVPLSYRPIKNYHTLGRSSLPTVNIKKV